MALINILDETTIDQIAAGEVVERPFNVVKELTENAIDAGASAITVQIKDGGIGFIRVTDNGNGITKSEIRKAFLRHATSKIKNANDLEFITSLGFRGEALSSICAVSKVQVISKEPDELMGFKYEIEGSCEKSFEDVGAPTGTTILVSDLFYNVPARRKFLKTPQTEGSYIGDLMEHIAMSHPDISVKFMNNQNTVFATSGNGDLLEVIFRVYGKDIKDKMIPFSFENEFISCNGYLGKPEVNRSNRNYESFFMNGRYVRCDVLERALEEGYKNFLMQHKFPFCVLHMNIDPSLVDVNIHPAKLTIRLHNSEVIYKDLAENVKNALTHIELIPKVNLDLNPQKEEEKEPIKAPEPFEVKRAETYTRSILPIKPVEEVIPQKPLSLSPAKSNIIKAKEQIIPKDISQMNLFDEEFLTSKAKDHYEILGQIFKTYWLIGFEDKLFIMDQHACHEKVKYERLLKSLSDKDIHTQSVNPPVIIDLTQKEEAIVKEYIDNFTSLGFEIEDFGLGSVAIRGIPMDLYGCDEMQFFREVLDELMENPAKGNYDVVLNKLASMACKAAVKGNTQMNEEQVRALLDELLTLDNPYNCPHGRPTIISMSKYEIDKKFKRIVN